jgi:cytoskeletal protein CcmA (bactofilin family)
MSLDCSPVEYRFRLRPVDDMLRLDLPEIYRVADSASKETPSFIQGNAPRTVLFPDSSISGKLSYNLPVKIDSRFSGEIKATELLVIGRNAVVDAQISARHLKLEGKLIGNVQVIGCFEISPGGHFQGEARVGELTIHPGAVFEGTGLILGGD